MLNLKGVVKSKKKKVILLVSSKKVTANFKCHIHYRQHLIFVVVAIVFFQMVGEEVSPEQCNSKDNPKSYPSSPPSHSCFV